MKEFVKIVVTVPVEESDNLRTAIGDAGGGYVGDYRFCSHSVSGTGRFLPVDGANPSIGEVGKLEQVREERIEITCKRRDAAKVVKAIRQTHSYEEPAIDIYPLLDPDYL
jgi:hypothetical protein